MGTLKVQDPPGSGNWVPVMPSVTGGLAFVARESYAAIYGNVTLTNNTNYTTNVWTPAVSRPQADLVFVKWDFNAQTTGNQQVGYTLQASVGGGAYFDVTTMTTHNNGNTSPSLGCTLTGWVPITPGQTIAFRVAIGIAGGGFNVNFGLANVSAEFFVSTGGGGSLSTPEPDWGSYTTDPNASLLVNPLSTAAVKCAFDPTSFKGVGVISSANGLMAVKAGVYDLSAAITLQGGSGAWVITEIRVYRAGSLIKTFSVVGTASAFNTVAVQGLISLLAGDVAYVYVTSSGTTGAVDGRSSFSMRQIATTGAASGELTAGFRGTTSQSIPNAAVTTVLVDSTPDHTCGGISCASSIVTIATAGVYQVSGGLQTNAFTSGAGRAFLRIEGWSGADPAVGSGTILCESDNYYGQNYYGGWSIQGQAYLPAGYRLRMYVYQGSGGTVTTVGAVQPAKLNIRKISQGGQPQDTGWIRAGAAGGPVWGSGWTDNDPNGELVVAKKIGTVVKVRGLAWRTSGSSTTMFTLPVGWRPTKNTYRPALISLSWAYIGLFPDGTVVASAGGVSIVNSSTAIGFDIEFDTAQP